MLVSGPLLAPKYHQFYSHYSLYMLIVLANSNFDVFYCILVGVFVAYYIVWLSIGISYVYGFWLLKCKRLCVMAIGM